MQNNAQTLRSATMKLAELHDLAGQLVTDRDLDKTQRIERAHQYIALLAELCRTEPDAARTYLKESFLPGDGIRAVVSDVADPAGPVPICHLLWRNLYDMQLLHRVFFVIAEQLPQLLFDLYVQPSGRTLYWRLCSTYDEDWAFDLYCHALQHMDTVAGIRRFDSVPTRLQHLALSNRKGRFFQLVYVSLLNDDPQSARAFFDSRQKGYTTDEILEFVKNEFYILAHCPESRHNTRNYIVKKIKARLLEINCCIGVIERRPFGRQLRAEVRDNEKLYLVAKDRTCDLTPGTWVLFRTAGDNVKRVANNRFTTVFVEIQLPKLLKK